MTGRILGCSSYRRELLTGQWEMAASNPVDASQATAPRAAAPQVAASQAAVAQTVAPQSHWLPAAVPGTVASALRAAGQWNLDGPPRAFDAEEWWYRCRFVAPAAQPGERVILGFEGLATLAEVWLNGHALLQSANMFRAHEVDVSHLLQPSNELLIRFTPLLPFLAKRRARPRWRTPMVSNQQLRWLRTTLLGRTPGWSPPAAPVGPWRPVTLERRRTIELGDLRMTATLSGNRGVLDVKSPLTLLGGTSLKAGTLTIVRRNERWVAPLTLGSDETGSALSGRIEIPDVEPWWPHTHGEPALYEAMLELTCTADDGAETTVDVDLGRVGFRTIELDRGAGDFALIVNGTRIFCRGAVWTPLDCVSLNSSAEDHSKAIEQVRAAGMNMLRVAGPFVYESDTFLDACDSSGILLWHDFMFANMDYPAEDAGFNAEVQREATQVLSRLQARPAIAVLCGNSEGAQQAAMSGAARELWAPALFEKTLARYSCEYRPDVPYCPSSTHGGPFPFAANEGATSYYGVGAYLQPLTDARRSELKFASECLAFANVPETETLVQAPDRVLHFNQPRWKERVPRDMGAGWDFDDVRDHYLERLFRLGAPALRYGEQDRYLRASRVVSGEVMSGAFAEWRRNRSTCRGALVWFLRDLWPGAGWGLIDSNGLPKAAYHLLKRVLQPLALLIIDEGSNGLALHIVNDGPDPVQGQLQLELYRASQPVGRPVLMPVSVQARSVLELNATQWFEGFVDLSYNYRFGPPSYDLLHARLEVQGRSEPVESFHFPLGLPNTQSNVGLSATARPAGDHVEVDIETRDFAQSVHLEVPGFSAEDQYFHLSPLSRRTVRMRPRPAQVEDAFQGTVHALNDVAARYIRLST